MTIVRQTFEALATLLGDRLSQSPSDLWLHGRNESYFAPCPPDAVAYPVSTEEVSSLARICSHHGPPWLAGGPAPRSKGTRVRFKAVS